MTHVSLSGGGARGLVFASFFDTDPGKLLLREATSFSAVSAGAIVATPLALGVPPLAIVQELENGGLSDWLHYPRALAIFMGWRTSMYNGEKMHDRLKSMCSEGYLGKPISIAVTTNAMKQVSIPYKKGYTDISSIFNTTLASAAVPGLFASRMVHGQDKPCFDGGAADCTFAIAPIKAAIQRGDNVVLFNSAPWPGYRLVSNKDKLSARILGHAFDVFNTHGLEWLPRELGPTFKFQDGVFTFDKVTLIAPTGKQYADSGGNTGSANLFYSGHSPFTRRLIKTGIQIADNYNTVKQGYFNGEHL